MNIAGNKIICGYDTRNGCPAANKVPTDVILPELRLIMPKYDNDVSEKIIPGIIRTELVIIVPKAFGKICLNIILGSLAPNVREARTYS